MSESAGKSSSIRLARRRSMAAPAFERCPPEKRRSTTALVKLSGESIASRAKRTAPSRIVCRKLFPLMKGVSISSPSGPISSCFLMRERFPTVPAPWWIGSIAVAMMSILAVIRLLIPRLLLALLVSRHPRHARDVDRTPPTHATEPGPVLTDHGFMRRDPVGGGLRETLDVETPRHRRSHLLECLFLRSDLEGRFRLLPPLARRDALRARGSHHGQQKVAAEQDQLRIAQGLFLLRLGIHRFAPS